MSPPPNDKKSKKFVSPNRIVVLASEEDNAIELDVMDDASNATDESIIPTQHDNSRLRHFMCMTLKMSPSSKTP